MPVSFITETAALTLFRNDLRKLAEDFAKRGGMRQPLIRAGEEVILESIRTNFLVGGRPDWPPHEPLGQYRGFGERDDLPTMMVSLKLFRAATARARLHISGNELTYGDFPSSAWYGVVHDSADLSAAAGHPHRPFALFQEEDVEPIRQIFLEWVEERVNRRIKLRYP